MDGEKRPVASEDTQPAENADVTFDANGETADAGCAPDGDGFPWGDGDFAQTVGYW